MQLNWLIYVNIQSRAVLLNHGLKQQICRRSFGRLHIEKEEALLDTKTRQALFAGPIVFEIMMHLTENDKVYFWLCHSIVRRWGELEVSVCRLVMMGNISKKNNTIVLYHYPCPQVSMSWFQITSSTLTFLTFWGNYNSFNMLQNSFSVPLYEFLSYAYSTVTTVSISVETSEDDKYRQCSSVKNYRYTNDHFGLQRQVSPHRLQC